MHAWRAKDPATKAWFLHLIFECLLMFGKPAVRAILAPSGSIWRLI